MTTNDASQVSLRTQFCMFICQCCLQKRVRCLHRTRFCSFGVLISRTRNAHFVSDLVGHGMRISCPDVFFHLSVRTRNARFVSSLFFASYTKLQDTVCAFRVRNISPAISESQVIFRTRFCTYSFLQEWVVIVSCWATTLKIHRKEGSLLKLNDCLVLVVVPKGGGELDPHWNWGSETSNTLLQSNLASPWLRLDAKELKC